MIKRLSGKKVLLTGSEGDIGSCIGKALIDSGAELFTIDKKPSKSGYDHHTQLDFENSQTLEKYLQEITSSRFTIDALINCAGFTKRNTNIFDVDGYNQSITINLTAPMRLCAAFIDSALQTQRPLSIINFTSLGASLGFPNNPGYQVSKAGLAQLSRSISVDFSARRIRANNIVPGYIHTSMTENSWNNPDTREDRTSRIPMKRWGQPDDLIGAVIFLASDESKYITGIDLPVDGGWLANGLSID